MERKSRRFEKKHLYLSPACAIVKAGLLFLAPAFFIPTLGWAQEATVVGSVVDPTSAAVPNAKVQVSNPSKGFNRVLLTNSAGEYLAAKIPIGEYVITAEATGFQKLLRSGITLQVGQTLRVDLQLTLGATTQEVSVTGNIT